MSPVWPRSSVPEHLVVIPDLWRSDATAEELESRTLDDEQWKRLAAGHDRLGRALLEEFGMRQQFHSHADSHVGTEQEVERFLAETDERYTTSAWTPAISRTTAATAWP